jgi:motility quorum-sensing regulator / GCU-specific mRNA interferase toxin
VKALIELEQVRATNVARIGATALGLDFEGMIAALHLLTTDDFYKSMTTHADHTGWQGVLIVSFKEQ